jgi:hypothetical protein
MPTTYLIFARKEHAEPLKCIGSVEAKDDPGAVAASLARYGPARAWLEMIAVPQPKIYPVFPEREATGL